MDPAAALWLPGIRTRRDAFERLETSETWGNASNSAMF